MRTFSFLLAAGILFPLGRPSAAEINTQPVVVPALQHWMGGTGSLDATGAAFFSKNPVLNGIARLANADRPASGTNPILELALEPAGSKIPSEGYRIDISDRVRIIGSTPTGVMYGTQTLLQMLAQSPRLPKGVVEDYPLCRRRMLMLDVGRRPFPVSALKDFLRMMAWFKMNELHLHLNDEAFGEKYSAFRVESTTFPELTAKDLFYTKKDLRSLQDYAHAYGITITPEFDSPGHSAAFTHAWPELSFQGQPSYLDVHNPEVIERMKRLFAEMIPLFDAPDFHIGTDEYRVQAPASKKDEIHNGFIRYINTMSAFVESKGKRCRVWFSPEHTQGEVKLNPKLVLDMWNIGNAAEQMARGHSVINSNEGVTYIVPGCHYYGVSNAHIYENWKPWVFTGGAKSANPEPSHPLLLGAKLHVWNDQGPTGYTLTEIAALVRPSMMAFAETLWGRQGFPKYGEFSERTQVLQTVPGVRLFDRLPARDSNGVVWAQQHDVTLANENQSMAMPYAGLPRMDLEYPWTLVMQVCKTAESAGRGVILSSDLVEFCDRYEDASVKPPRRGLAWVRAAGSPGPTPADAHLSKDVSHVYADSLPLNRWVTIAVVGTAGRTTVYLDGKKAGEHGDQMVCPLARLGSSHGGSLIGTIRNLKVYNREWTPAEIQRMAESNTAPATK